MGFRDQNNKVAPIDDGGNFDTDTNVNSVTSTSEAAANALISASHAEDALAAKIAAELAETNAETAETNAETAETNASTSATNAATSETNASTSETNAAASASAAASSAADAQSSEDDAEVSETNAANSAAAALVSENNASSSESNAATSAVTAATQAGISTTKAGESSVSAAAALVSENNASTSETNAAASETNAATSESNAATSAVSAETAKTNAETAETNAATSETNAAASAVTSTTQAGIATTKAGEALTSANNAEAAKVAAAASQVAASNSQLAAATSASSAAAVFDQFDDTYLGSKASEPTVDNDGNALVVGALFYNSSTQGMFIWTGTEWVAASAAGGASLNNFSYTATAGQTTFTGSDENTNNLSYTVDNIIVTLNGVVLEGGGTDYTATDGSSIVLTSGAALSDEVNIVAFKTFTTADMVSSANGGAFQGNVDFNAGIDVTGNITVTGTVDGVDVAAFKASYDALDLDGDYVNSTGDSMTGDLALSGADVTFGDNDKAIFGAGSDLQIYHDTLNSVIADAGTGNLVIAADDFRLTNSSQTANMIKADEGGAVTLTHDGGNKLATTSTGVDITGTLTSDGIILGNNNKLIFQDNGGTNRNILSFDTGNNIVIGGAGAGVNDIVLKNNGAKDRLKVGVNGDISFYEDTGTTPKFFWDASAEILDLASGFTVGSPSNPTSSKAVVKVADSATAIQAFEVTNRVNADFVFKVESNLVTGGSTIARPIAFMTSNTEAMRIDSSGNVGIGTSSPSSKLHLSAAANTSKITISSTDYANINEITAGLGNLSIFANTTTVLGAAYRYLNFGVGTTEAMRIDSSGNVGIGNTAPDGNLTIGDTSTSGDVSIRIKGDATSRGFVMFGDTGGAQLGDIMYDHSTNHMRFRVNNSEAMRIDSNGNVGIGTSSPSSFMAETDRLVVGAGSGNEGATIYSGSSSLGAIYFADGTTGDTRYRGYIGYQHNGDYMYFGTAASEAMRIDSSGNVGIGTSSPAGTFHVAGGRSYLESGSGDQYILKLTNPGNADGVWLGSPAVDSLAVYSAAGSERMRIDSSGRLLLNRTTTATSGIINLKVGVAALDVGVRIQAASDGNWALAFQNSADTNVGQIIINSSSTSYNTSSDYRLKTDAQPMTGASARVQALKPVNFEWISTGERVDGFLAHEAQEVVPEAVSGAKDAMRDEEYEVTPAVLDDDGNVVTEAVMGTRSVPDYQGIDQSKLVPLLTAALQEALTKIDALETRITALEG